MKEIPKTVYSDNHERIKVNYYVTSDGKEFSNEKTALYYESLLSRPMVQEVNSIMNKGNSLTKSPITKFIYARDEETVIAYEEYISRSGRVERGWINQKEKFINDLPCRIIGRFDNFNGAWYIDYFTLDEFQKDLEDLLKIVKHL